jgi:hypothetical protein
MVNLHAQPQAPPPSRDGLGDFQCTKPPIFSYAVDLMDADDWLKFIEKKLQVVQCNNHEKVQLASHQLSGPAINWSEFKATFRAHHVPQGVIKLKNQEF